MQASWLNPKTDIPIVRTKRHADYPFFSLIIYDVDAPFPYSRTTSPHLHLMKANVACTATAGASLWTLGLIHGDTVVPYESPDPLKHIPHCYMIEVVGHQRPIDPVVERDVVSKSGRTCYDLKAFRERNHLASVAKGYFIYNGHSNAVKTNGR